MRWDSNLWSLEPQPRAQPLNYQGPSLITHISSLGCLLKRTLKSVSFEKNAYFSETNLPLFVIIYT